MKRIIQNFLIFLLLSISSFVLHAQTDKEFWFAAPDLTSAHCDNPIYLRFLTLDLPAIITVSQPANPGFTPIQISIPANQSNIIDLSPFKSVVECAPADNVLNYGLHITSTQWIQATYEVICNNNEIFTLKGRNAPGLSFVVPFQQNYNNASLLTPMPVCSFTIVALQDNTTVTVIPSKNIVGHAAGIPFTITLNKGQAYSANATTLSAAAHLGGSIVTSDKPVVVNTADDSAVMGTHIDLLGDQLIPESKIGTDYVVVKGFMPANADRVYVYGTVDNTQVYIDGNASPAATINRGQYYTFTIPNANVSTFIHADYPVYVTHLTGSGQELCDAVVPPLQCTGNQMVEYNHTFGTTSCYGFFVVPAGGEGNFTVGGSSSVITAASFSPVPGTGGQWMAAKVNLGGSLGPAVKVENSSVKFLMGIVKYNASGSNYGYFTDYGPMRIDLGNDTFLCPNQTVTLNAGYPSFTYLWQDGSVSQTFLVSLPGKYSVTVTDPEGCSDTNSILVSYYPAGLVTWNTNITPHCVSDPAFTLSGGLPNGGTYTGPSVAGGLFSPSIGSGTYSLLYTANDANGCQQSDSNTIVVNVLPVVTFPGTLPDLCASSVSYDLTTGEPPGGTYSGLGVAGNNFNAFLAGPGLHQITYSFTDLNGCTNSAVNSVYVNPLPTVTFDDTLDPQCANYDMYQLTGGSPLGGTYTGAGVQGFIFNASLAGPGTHTITYSYSDGNGCIGIDTNTIIVYEQTDVTWNTVIPPMCLYEAPFLLTGGFPEGGVYYGPGTVGNAFSPAFAGPGTHVITYAFMDTNGCLNSATNNITVNAIPMVELWPFPDVCASASPFILNNGIPAGGTYSGTGVVAGEFDPSLAGPGTFAITYTYTDQNNCTSLSSQLITVNPIPIATASVDVDLLCEGGSIAFTGTASGGSGSGYTYLWTGPGFTSTDANPVIPAVLPSNTGLYSLVVTDDNLCSSVNTASVNVTVNPRPDAIANVNDSVICLGQDLQFGGSGSGGSGSGYLYHWEGPSGFVWNTQNPVINGAVVSNAGIYYLTVTDDALCSSASPANITIVVNPLPLVSASSDESEVCEGDTIHLAAVGSDGSGGGYTFTWIGPGGYTSTLQNPILEGITLAQSGTYSVNVQDDNQCIASIPATVSILVHPRPILTASVLNDTICAGASLEFNATASGGSNSGYIFSWTGPGPYSSALADPVIANAQPANSGIYTVNLIDSNGCYALDTVSIPVTVFPNPVATATTPNASLCAGGNIQLNAQGNGGLPPYTYAWTGTPPFSSTLQNPLIPNAQPNQSGTYSLTVTDSNGCSSTNIASLDILVYANPVVDATTSQAIICSGNTFNLTAIPSTGYTYSWNGPNFFASTSGGPVNVTAVLAATGYYYVTITDSHNCQGKDSVLVTVNPSPVATAGSNSPICAGATLNLNCTPNGMTTYQWTGPSAFTSNAQNPTRTNALTTYSGTYSVTVTNSYNCPAVASTNVIINPLPVANAGPDQNINYGIFVNLAGSATGCTGNCNFTWTPAAMLSTSNTIINPTTVNLTATQLYILTVQNTVTGCISQPDSVTIYVSGSAIATNPIAIPYVICAGGSSQLLAQPSGGNLSYNYTWSPALGLSSTSISNPIASPLVTTTYSVTVSDGFNQVTGQVTVQVVDAPQVFAGSDTTNCFGSPILMSQAIASFYCSIIWTTNGDGTFDDTSIMNPVYTPGPQDILTGNFVLTMDGSGCTPCGIVSDDVLVSISPHTTAYAGEDDTICEGSTYSLSNATAFNADTLTWTSSGDGSFDDTGLLQPIYSPGPNDIINGTVTLTLSAANPVLLCGDSTDSMILVIKPLPNSDAGQDTAFCAGDTIQLQASGGNSYIWIPATGLSDDSISNPTAFPSTTTTYTVSVTLNGCSKTDDIIITVRPLPNLSLSPDQHICFGDSAHIWASGASSWIWSTGSTESSLWVTPPFSSFYYVTGTDTYGCSNAAQIVVFVDPLPLMTVNPPAADICLGEFVSLTVQGAQSYLWSPKDGISNPYSGLVQAGPTHTIEYTVTGTSTEGCVNDVQVLITVWPRPVITLQDSAFLCLGDKLTVNAGWNDNVTYQWQDGTISQYYTIEEPGIYYVVASNAGCHIKDTLDVYPCAILWAPNAFTPDGNNVNDVFLVKSSTELLEYQIYIYSRKGELVYHSDDIYAGWDGKFKGSMCELGVFTWVIFYKSRDAGPQLMKGTVTLMH